MVGGGKDTSRFFDVGAIFQAVKVSKWYLKVDVPPMQLSTKRLFIRLSL